MARLLASLADGATLFAGNAEQKLARLRAELAPLAKRYDIVVANPPYMGGSNMNRWLNAWTKKNYKETCRDLCTCFVRRGMELARPGGYEALITSDTCMYISSFEKMRKMVIDETTIVAFIDTRGTNAHPDVFDANAGWVLWMGKAERMEGAYFKLSQPIAEKEARYLEALADPGCGWFYRTSVTNFTAIPGSVIAYWISEALIRVFKDSERLDYYSDVKKGLSTGENELFLRLWWEVGASDAALSATSSSEKWYPYNKGGTFRKWYGNYDYIIDWKNNGESLRAFPRSILRNAEYYFRPAVTWSDVSSGCIAFRYRNAGSIHDGAGASLFPKTGNDRLILGCMNSSCIRAISELLSPTLHFEIGQVSSYPVILPSGNLEANTQLYVDSAIKIAKDDWDTGETSWGFKSHQLI